MVHHRPFARPQSYKYCAIWVFLAAELGPRQDGKGSPTYSFLAPLESASVTQSIPCFDYRNSSLREHVQGMARKRNIAESRLAFRSAKHLQRNFAPEMRRAGNARPA